MSASIPSPQRLLSLHVAAFNPDGARLALALGADPNAPADDGCPSELWRLCRLLCGSQTRFKEGARSALRVLLKGGADARRPWRDETCLHYLARFGEAEGVKIVAGFCPSLIDAGDARGRTPLMLACESLREPAALALLELGASVTIRDHAGRSALSAARQARPASLASSNRLLLALAERGAHEPEPLCSAQEQERAARAAIDAALQARLPSPPSARSPQARRQSSARTTLFV